VILAVGAVDRRGIAGSCGVRASWAELGVEPLGTGRTFRELFSKQDQTYRRLDRQTRAIVLAAEACGVSQALTAEQRQDTALVTETSLGSIEVDLRYTRSLRKGFVEAAVFPYTLQSTCLGDVALRHGLRGPTVCLSIEGGQEGAALLEARRLLVCGGARFAIVGMVDVLGEALPTADVALRSVVAVVAAPGYTSSEVALWPEGAADPLAALAETCLG